MALYEITVIDAPWQRLDTFLSDTAVSLELFWNGTARRWALSVEVEGIVRLQGRRIVPSTDLFANYKLGIGRLFLVDWTDQGGEPDREALPAGVFRLIHDDGLPA